MDTSNGFQSVATKDYLIDETTYKKLKRLKIKDSIDRNSRFIIKIFFCLISASIFYADEISDILLSADYYEKCIIQNIRSYKNCSLVICNNEINYCGAFGITLFIVVGSWLMNATIISYSNKNEIQERWKKGYYLKAIGIIFMAYTQIDFIYW